MTSNTEKTSTPSKNHPDRFPAAWDAMITALRFALPLMEDLANSSDNENEHRAAHLMRTAIVIAEGR